MIGKRVVQFFGLTVIIGGLIFFWALLLPGLAYFLWGVGLVLELSTLGWSRRYENVLPEPPEDFEPTGEVYANPGGDGAVAVWHKGSLRVYVRKPTA